MRDLRIAIGVLTAKNYDKRRQACRDTWAGTNLPSNVDLMFLIGDPSTKLPYRKKDILYCPCPDDYPSLPQKTRWFCLWALANCNCDYLFKCDDDTYLAVDRLLEILPSHDYFGYDIQGYASGGAGYALSRQAALVVAAHMHHKTGPEDRIVRDVLQEAKIPFVADARFHAWNNRSPRPGNQLISCHYCKPQRLHRIHQRLTGSTLPGKERYRLQAKHPYWEDEIILFDDGVMARSKGDEGEYELDLHKRLLLRWDSWAEELLLWDERDHLYRSPDKDFTVRIIPHSHSADRQESSFQSSVDHEHNVVDQAPPEQYIMVAGMGRSGTTWLSQVINHRCDFRVLFEPFCKGKVPETLPFQQFQYIDTHRKVDDLEEAAREILAGVPKGAWIDRDNTTGTYHHRLIKMIRCNLMLGWLSQLSSQPIVLLIRNPFQVAHSWLRLDWTKKSDGNCDDFDAILSQPELLRDYPLVSELAEEIDSTDEFLRIIFQWCVLHYIPRQQLNSSQAFVVFYESLIKNGVDPSTGIFEYLNISVDREKLEHAWHRPSSANFLGRDFSVGNARLLNEWKSFFTAEQISKATAIINKFGLGDLYDSDGMPTGRPLLEDSRIDLCCDSEV
ncbi:hypothetical protein GC197_14565 [bacterium]|nr:hypothetical protein [bacterium]